MSNEVIFGDEQANTVSNIEIVRGAPTGMLMWLVKNKVIANARQGEQLLLIFVIIVVLLTVGTVFFFVNSGTAHRLSQQQIQTIIQNQNTTPRSTTH